MSSYFDKLNREVRAAAATHEDDAAFIDAIVEIEGRLFRDVTAITGDREFPDDLRETILNTLAVEGVYQPGSGMPANTSAVRRVLRSRCSWVVEDVHDLFHDLARRQIFTRFGRLTDNPVFNRDRRDAHDTGG